MGATNTSTGNVGAGDLELAPNGTPYTFNGSFTLANIPGQTQNALYLTGYASAGYSSAIAKKEIWTGSQLIANFDAFTYSVWVSSTSPAIVASCDFVCSDGTTLSGSGIVDGQGISNVAANDLSGLANDQWLIRNYALTPLAGKTLVSVNVNLAGTSVGTYNAYFSNISYTVNATSTTTNIFGPASNLTHDVNLAVSGYTNVHLTQVSTAVSNINEIFVVGTSFGGVSITGPTLVANSDIFWVGNLPSGVSVRVDTSIDGQGTWQTATSGNAIPNLLPGMQASLLVFSVRTIVQMGVDPTQVQAGLSSLNITIQPAYQATKSDVFTSYASGFAGSFGITANQFNIAGAVFTNTQQDSNSNALELLGFQRNWDDSFFADQPLYGSSSPNQSASKKQFILSSNSTADARSRLDFAGQWQNFTAEVDVTVPAGIYPVGMVYRCGAGNWQNANDTYAYMVMVSTSGVQFGHGTNTGSGAGAFTNIQTVALSLATNSTHRLKLVVNGNTHQAYLDGVLVINATDATYPATGYLGLRTFANSGTVTGIFDNFGVCSALSGTWQSPSINIASPGHYGGSLVEWDPNTQPYGTPADPSTSITVQTSIDNGSTWQSVSNGGAISGLTIGQSLTGKTLLLKVSLTAQSATIIPTLYGLSVWVLGQYSSSGQRSTAPLAWDSATRLNVASGWGVASNGQSYTQNGTGATDVNSNELQISNTTGDVVMSLPGSGTDLEATVRLAISSSTMTAGINLRYVDANNYYRLQVSTTTVSIVGKNSGLAFTIASVPMTISINTYYHLRFNVAGSGPITFNGRVWADGSVEPANWTVTGTL